MNDNIKCVFCGATKPDVEAAIEADWSPSYDNANGDEVDGPICDNCTALYLAFDDSLQALVVRPDAELPESSS